MGTNTKSDTRSIARTTLIGCQIRVLMGSLYTGSEEFNEETVNCVLEGLAKKITFCAMDGEECMAKLSVEVDWEKHGILVSKSGRDVNYSGDETLFETSEVIRAMKKFTEGTGWKMRVYYTCDREDTEKLCRRLNLRPSRIPPIKGSSQKMGFNPYELEELNYILEMKE